MSTDSLFTNEFVRSKRVVYTCSSFARSSLLYIQETGTLTSLKPHISSRIDLSSYLFFIVLSGEGWVEFENIRYEIRAGDVVMIDCRRGYKQSSSDDLWSFSWVHWNGNNMGAVYNKLKERGLRPVFHPADLAPYRSILGSIYDTATSESYIRDVELNNLINDLLSLMFAETVYEGENAVEIITAQNSKSANLIDIMQIKSYLDLNYKESLTLESVSRYFYISKNYLARIFKETYGMTVNNYIGMVRIGKAKEMLRFSDMCIEAVAFECGYSDANFFRRKFKKVEGCSPSEFRKVWRGEKARDEKES